MNKEKRACIDDGDGEESTETESSNSEKVDEKLSRGKGIITNANVEEINERDVDNEIHDNIGGGEYDYFK